MNWGERCHSLQMVSSLFQYYRGVLYCQQTPHDIMRLHHCLVDWCLACMSVTASFHVFFLAECLHAEVCWDIFTEGFFSLLCFALLCTLSFKSINRAWVALFPAWTIHSFHAWLSFFSPFLFCFCVCVCVWQHSSLPLETMNLILMCL